MHPWVRDLSGSTVAAYWNGEQAAVTAIRLEGLVLRTSKEFLPGEITVHFLHFDTGRYESVALGCLRPAKVTREQGAYLAEFAIENRAFAQAVNRLLLQQGRYMRLREAGDEAFTASQLTGCPEEETLAGAFLDEKQKWLAALTPAVYPEDAFAGVTLAVSLDNPRQYEGFLKDETSAFLKRWMEKNGYSRFAVAGISVKRLYIGNGFCRHLRPENTEKLLDKAFAAGLAVTLVMPCVGIGEEAQAEKALKALHVYLTNAGKTVEIACNDVGLLRRAAAFKSTCTPVMGLLLAKRPKDPRGMYLPQRGGETALNLPEYRQWLRAQYGACRVEAEACRLLPWPQPPFSVHLPFYVTNASPFCPLAARVAGGGRGNQAYVTACPRFCEKYAFSYPAWMKTVGRYNAVFALEEQALDDPAFLLGAVSAGADRLVLEGLE